VARATLGALPDGASLVASSSMPVRDLEWYTDPREGVRVLANRGANGIDGVVSTAVGVALGTQAPTALLIGDVALLHDANGFLGLAERAVDLVVVAVDNRGGGIFEFLPQAAQVPRDRFERLFGTPHQVHLPGVAGLHGVGSWTVDAAADVGPAVAHAVATGGVHLVHVHTDRRANVAVHHELHRAVQAALT
jgi:2-succinyl-5-enolpyruvyl-6-hydroxy-3-cyclohexene-1-carboxylate synthase